MKTKSKNPWIVHINKVKLKHPGVPLKKIIPIAKKTYVKVK